MKRRFYLAGITMITLILGLWGHAFAAASEKARSYDLAELIGQHVQNNSSWDRDDIRIEFPVPPGSVDLQGRNISHDVSASGKDALIGKCTFVVRFFRDGVVIARNSVRANIEIRETYLTSARQIKKNVVIQPEDVQVVKRWVRTLSIRSISDPQDVAGKRLTVDIGPDREIKQSMVSEPLLIKRGEVVRIVLDGGQMALSTTGTAEENGAEGQKIRVKNISSQKVIMAEVVRRGMVKVESF
ncbi:MAG: flagellar basal body P-ring formation chaperone FlgA [Syntrophobacterales bacterium]|jgi:flagella basal body P-ring formation protein FlgA|nr:flagellar basal body P-ring formation chaperone FlgA [Syntrophobacterales bacterium]